MMTYAMACALAVVIAAPTLAADKKPTTIQQDNAANVRSRGGATVPQKVLDVRAKSMNDAFNADDGSTPAPPKAATKSSSKAEPR